MNFQPRKPREPGTTQEIVSRLFAGVEGGMAKIMLLTAKRKSQLYRYADNGQPEAKADISFDDVRRLTSATGLTAAAEALAFDAGGYFVPGEASKESLGELMAREEIDHGKLMSELMRRLKATDLKRADLLELIRDCARLHGDLTAVLRKLAEMLEAAREGAS